MPPKIKVSREMIAKEAFELVKRDGIGALSAKNLAKQLKCSTQPLFWQYENMDEIRKVVLESADSLFIEYLRSGAEGVNPYKAIGINYIRFAKEQKQLFKALFMSDNNGRDVLSSIEQIPFILDALNTQSVMDKECSRIVMREMWLFAHGIATMTATDTAQFEQEDVNRMLSDVFKGLLNNYGEKSYKN